MSLTRLRSGYRRIVWAALFATFFLIVVGGIVRVSGSGLGCSEWPSCEGGNPLPPLRTDALIEVSHRASASVVSVLIVATVVGALAFYRHRSAIWGLAAGILGLLIVQIVLGGITVLMELPEDVVTLHLGTAQAILAGLVVLSLVLGRPTNEMPATGRSRFWWLAVLTAAAVYLVVLSGAYVRGHGAASACGTDWPLCQGSLWPVNEMTAVHLGHRYLVLLVTGLVLWTGLAGWSLRRQAPGLGRAALTLLALYALQIVVGALNPLTGLAPAAQAAHLAAATLVWGASVALATLAWWVQPAGAQDRAPRGAALGTSSILTDPPRA